MCDYNLIFNGLMVLLKVENCIWTAVFFVLMPQASFNPALGFILVLHKWLRRSLMRRNALFKY